MKRLRAMTDRAIVRLIAARVAEEQEREAEGKGKDGGAKGKQGLQLWSGDMVCWRAGIYNKNFRFSTTLMS